MYNITLVCTTHKENGECNSNELYNIIENIKPEIIFEELSYEVFNQCYGERNRISLETTAIKWYLKNNAIKHIPIDTYEIPISDHDNFDKMHNVLTQDIDFGLFLNKAMWRECIRGFSYLNSRHIDETHRARKNYEKELIGHLNRETLTNTYNLWNDYNDRKEDTMVDNIYSYSKNNEYTNAILFIGSAHRKSMIMKINKIKRKEKPMLYWKFYNFNKISGGN
ncbi:MAG: hypothetical protein FWC64_01945 [Treponema sp.]|nr:hypothetical protein [Treponema sp.]